MNEHNTQQLEATETETSQPIFEIELNALRTENDQLRSELRLRTARDELTRVLAAEHARSPELLFDASTGRLEFDDDGKLKNIDDLIGDLKIRFPEQFAVSKPGSPPPTPPINAGAGRSPNRQILTKDALSKMKPHDIAKLDWNEVKQVLEQ